MKFKQLTIQNLASIAHAEVDFDGDVLRNEPLFLITGDTGSGKTTLLDAICLALYGTTPRMSVKSNEKYMDMPGNDDSRVELTVGDVRQLLRRGTTEARVTLTFDSNDGVPFMASWSIGRGKRKNKLDKTPVRELHNLRTHEVINKVAELKTAVPTIVGLTFEQFCRTTMLAQGEFTHFLKSNENEKAEILEKLTGTEIYGRVGRKIYDTATACRARMDQAQAAAAAIMETLLSDERRAQIDAELQACAHTTATLKTAQQAATAKLDWLKRDDELRRAMKKNDDDTAYQREELRTLAQWLAGARVFLADRLTHAADALPALRAECDRLATERDSAKRVLDERAEAAQQALDRLYAIDIDSLRRREHTLVERRQQLQQLEAAIKAIAEREQTHAAAVTTHAEAAEALAKAREALPLAQTHRERAQRDHDAVDNAYQIALAATGEWAQEVRRRLTAGDRCPVCGHVIDEALDAADIVPALAPLKEKADRAKKQLDEAILAVGSAQTAITQHERAVKQAAVQVERAATALAQARDEVTRLCDACGLTAPATDEQIALSRADIDAQMEQVAAEMKHHVECAARVQATGKARDEAAKVSDRAVKQLQQATDRLNTAMRDAELLRQRIAQQQRAVDERVAALQAIVGEYLDAVTPATCSHEIIDTKCRSVDVAQGRLAELQSAAATIKRNIDEHTAQRPAIDEADTIPSLADTLASLATKLQDEDRRRGALQQQLEADRRSHALHDDKIAQYEQLRLEWLRWDSLSELSDREGKKFRRIAQSLILGELLERANHYLRQFNNHYELTCQPGSLTILVSDRYMESAQGAAPTLSGGESFMASLALALALAQAGESSLGPDLLFIDEGFGTLDGVSRDMVTDALERLHQLGGRRVGIISHVAQLQERIATQVRVERVNDSMSRVTVTK